MRNSRNVKILAALLVGSLLLTVVPAQAQQANTPKEEVVYANLCGDGSVAGIYVVNSFMLNEAGQIIDYGDYTALRNMTSSEALQMQQQRITIDAQAGRLYYEGILEDTALPWLFTIQYWLDGEAVSAEQLAGQSGHMQLDLQIAQNPACNAVFFENYALQVTLQLDTQLCRNIRAEGATLANVGRKKQITYTILPGNAQTCSVSADVTNFTMEQISINGVTLSMAIDLDENQYPELKNGLRQITDTAVQFDEGTLQLFDGMEALRLGAEDLRAHLEELQQGTSRTKDGGVDLQQGTADLRNGAADLSDGVQKAAEGANDLQKGAATLGDGAKKLKESAEQLWQGADRLDDGMEEALQGAEKLHDGAGTLEERIDEIKRQSAELEALLQKLEQNQQLQQKLQELLGKLEGHIPTGSQLEFVQAIEQLEQFGAQLNQAVDDLERMSQGIDELYDGLVVLRQGSAELLEGLEQLKDGTAQLEQGVVVVQDGSAALYQGIAELQDGSRALLSGAVELQDGAVTLSDGLVQLEDGTVALCDGAIQLEDGILRLEDGLIELQGGTMQFRDRTANLDRDMLAQLRAGIDQLFGSGDTTVSFVSEQNTNVQSVQFVIRTPAIELEEPAQPPETAPEKLTFWQKLLRLFGIGK